MSTFKVLFLPFLVLEEIVKTMGLIDVFELSLTSRRMFAIVKLTKRKILPLNVFLSESLRRIKIAEYKTREGKEDNYKLNFEFEGSSTTLERQFKLNGLEINIKEKNDKHETYPGFFLPFETDFYLVLSYLLELFPCPGIYLGVKQKLISDNLLAHPVLLKTVYLLLYGYSEPGLTNNQLSTVLKHTKPNGISLNCLFDKNFNPEIIYNIRRVHMDRVKLINIEHLLNMKSDMIFLQKHTLTPNDFKRFVRQWLNGTNRTFFRLRLRKLEMELDLENMLEGIEYAKWDGKRRSRFFITHSTYSIWEKDCKDGWDFEREDGKLATVTQNEENVDFLVWHNRFPTVTKY